MVAPKNKEWDVITATDGGSVIWRRYSDGLLVVARKDQTPEQALAAHLLHDSPWQIN
jgi:hypothetical protein